MDVIRPIPKRLLIHSVTLHRKASEDVWGKESLDDGMQLNHVRMEPSSKVVRNKSGAEIQLAATLFYDCCNSRPSGVEFQEDDIIVFNGQKHKVQMIEPLYDEKKLHHYEMGLVKHA